MEHSVLKFWFEELSAKDWFSRSDKLDEEIRQRFAGLHQQAIQGELYTWRSSAKGRLAEVIVLDQFSRNLFRDSPKAFAADSMAIALAQEAVRIGSDKELTQLERSFLYMPYMHSESALIHKVAVELFEANGQAGNTEYEYKHKAIIDRFGRYPHRNQVLDRQSTAEEIEFLKQPGSSF
ncbi:DUF924 family protein [Vibrio sp. SCSIO 43137]|uniref:DUF924 family protein n=1 Tax=Vibrio sp. SCSIO 43137 TaxID=3021011 RepID=UPI0023076249|nr:DUF924 family protein [Vibrio sp. SCSIO 43137]WCE29396.1 DUF924 domain-containing protein [Vibrio sp. SCSIO 43137]